ncbi:MAG TPA: PKD domain-containing protein, partial [Fibrella sp.]
LISLPFEFCFFGTKYNALVIGSNGNVSFNAAVASGYNAFGVTNAIPFNYASYNNCILSPFYDIDPRGYGAIRYATYGTAPCRTFVISYDSLGTFPCPGSGCPYVASQQVVLYESTYVIDINIKNKTYFTGSTSSGYAVLGIQNATATLAYSFPGRNNAQWSETNKSYRFTPNGTPTANYQWVNLNNNTVVGSGPTVNVCPTVQTTYQLNVQLITQCDTVTVSDNVVVTPVPGVTIAASSVNPAVCGGLGTITLTGLAPNTIYTVYYTVGGNNVAVNIASSATGVIVLSLPAGTYSGIRVGASTNGCFSNTVGPISLLNPPITAAYNYTIKYGCDQDTVVFQNLSATPGGLTQVWDFGDGTQDTTRNPTKIYPNQGIYTVKLRVTNGACADSNQQSIDVLHPLVASYTQSGDSFCQGGIVTFTNTSTTTTRLGISPKYFWSFGDGGTDTVENPIHTYTRAGVWPVTLTVRDFVPCVDTATSVVVIDSIPFVSISLSDSVLCEGQAVTFKGDFLQLNNTGHVWNFGDGTPEVRNRNPATHGYEGAGTYTVTLTAEYRICADTAFTREVEIRPFTSISLGSDTSICPGGEPLMLSARVSDGSLAPGSAVVRWSTGDTSTSILVRHQGDYWATADLAGCTSTDSIHVAKDCYLDLPNVFSPNGDGTNDYFWPRQLLSEGVTAFHMVVFNRWGQKIWESTRI